MAGIRRRLTNSERKYLINLVYADIVHIPELLLGNKLKKLLAKLEVEI